MYLLYFPVRQTLPEEPEPDNIFWTRNTWKPYTKHISVVLKIYAKFNFLGLPATVQCYVGD